MFISLAILSFLLLGCEDASTSDTPEDGLGNTPEGETDISDAIYPKYEPRMADSDECLDLTLEAPETYALGSTLTAALNLKNICPEAYTFYLSGSAAHDFLIVNPEGLVVWRESRYLPQQDVLLEEILAPNESVTYAMTWDGSTIFLSDGQPVEGEQAKAGQYQVVGRVDTRTVPEETSNLLEVSSGLSVE